MAHILIVEDHPGLKLSPKECIEKEGHRADVAGICGGPHPAW